MNETTGIETARKKAAEIKKSADKEKAELATQHANSLNTVVSQDVLDMLQANAGLGAQDMGMGASSPVLRVHSSSSTKNQLANGQQPTIGNFFYTANKEEFAHPIVRILYVKQCKLPKLKQRQSDPEELKSNYVIAGLLADTDEPFVMFINGMAYNKVWELQDAMKPWVKKMKLPMFSLQVKLSTMLEQDQKKDFAPRPVPIYELVMNETKEFPIIETDKDRIQFLIKATKQAEEVVNEMVAQLLEKHGFEAPAQPLKSTSYRGGGGDNGAYVTAGGAGGDGNSQDLLEEPPTEVEDISDEVDIPF